MNLKNKNIWIAGRTGLLGKALEKKLNKIEFVNIIKENKRFDYRDQKKVSDFFKKNKIDIVFLLAARVGGIYANMTYPADFIYDNLMIESNIINQSYKSGIKNLVFLGSSCIYPKKTNKLISEKELLSGYLEPTNEFYSIAKIAGLKLCEAYSKQYNVNSIAAMPTNMYGPNDNFHSRNSHVVPALIKKVYYAKKYNKKSVVLWGNGKPKRELLYSEDCADALIFIIKNYKSKEIINIGSGEEISILNILKTIMKKFDYNGKIVFDRNMPNGKSEKKMNISKLNKLGWKPNYTFNDGLDKTLSWFKNNF